MTLRTHTSRSRTLAASVLVALLLQGLSGCASAAQSSGPELNDQEKAAVQVAQRTLATNSSVRTDEFAVRSVVARAWPDSSLGCPQPGMSYLQVITPGYVVTLDREGKTQEVRVAGEFGVICGPMVEGVARRAGSATRIGNLQAMETEAIADLARRLNIPAEQLRVQRRMPQRWADESLACTAPPETISTQGPVAGYKLVIDAGPRVYSYHTDMKKVLACPPIEDQ